MAIELTRKHAILTVVLFAMMSLGVYLTNIHTTLIAPPTGAQQIALPPCFLIYFIAERGTFIFWESWILLAFWVFVTNLATAVIILRLLDMVRASEHSRR